MFDGIQMKHQITGRTVEREREREREAPDPWNYEIISFCQIFLFIRDGNYVKAADKMVFQFNLSKLATSKWGNYGEMNTSN